MTPLTRLDRLGGSAKGCARQRPKPRFRRFADWFGGAETEVPLSTISIDLRPGGAWRATTLSYGPDRRDICWEGEYLEIIEPERLAFTIRGLHPDQVGEVATVILTDLGDGRTEMLFHQQGK